MQQIRIAKLCTLALHCRICTVESTHSDKTSLSLQQGPSDGPKDKEHKSGQIQVEVEVEVEYKVY